MKRELGVTASEFFSFINNVTFHRSMFISMRDIENFSCCYLVLPVISLVRQDAMSHELVCATKRATDSIQHVSHCLVLKLSHLCCVNQVESIRIVRSISLQ